MSSCLSLSPLFLLKLQSPFFPQMNYNMESPSTEHQGNPVLWIWLRYWQSPCSDSLSHHIFCPRDLDQFPFLRGTPKSILSTWPDSPASSPALCQHSSNSRPLFSPPWHSLGPLLGTLSSSSLPSDLSTFGKELRCYLLAESPTTPWRELATLWVHGSPCPNLLFHLLHHFVNLSLHLYLPSLGYQRGCILLFRHASTALVH